MVYLFHFERPVVEATWPCFATVYRPYLKCLTFSEVDARASSVMHLSRAYVDDVDEAEVGAGVGGGGGNNDDADVENAIADGRRSDIITFMSFFYVNTKKGKWVK